MRDVCDTSINHIILHLSEFLPLIPLSMHIHNPSPITMPSYLVQSAREVIIHDHNDQAAHRVDYIDGPLGNE